MAIDVFPVVHVDTARQAVEQSELAIEAGADGIYLIDHQSFDPADLMTAFNAVKASLEKGTFIGINFLQADTSAEAFGFISHGIKSRQLIGLPSGLWHDNAEPDADITISMRHENPFLRKISYLGGVSFKGTNRFYEGAHASMLEADRLKDKVDVVTTSGRGTGTPPNPAKIAAMKTALTDKDGTSQPLAVASGIDADNIALYAGMFDQLLVASSVETEPGSGVFDEARLRDLIQIAHEL